LKVLSVERSPFCIEELIFSFTFTGNLLLNTKKGFSDLSLGAKNGNKFAAIEPLAGIHFPHQFKRMRSSVPISTISQEQESCCHYKSQNRFPPENMGKLSVNGLSTISSLKWEPCRNG
jgi:hypothetical protein